MRWTLAGAAIIAAAALAAWAQRGVGGGPKVWDVKVVAAYPHDPAAFTQGLVIHDGRLYEGTGQYGASTLRRVDLPTGRVEQSRRLANNFFGEGITILGDRIYQLTWQNQVGIVYDLESFDVLETFGYRGEGWGLTHDGEHLIVSDGSATLKFMDPATFDVVREIAVTDQGRPVTRLNELEYIDGEVWANVWYEDRIVRISPKDGSVVGWVEVGNLYPPSRRGPDDVLNGIAFDPAAGRLFVTGKNWPQLFEIELERR